MTRRNTRELILTTSLGLFNELGEPNVTTNLIADEADISPGNLYYHFRSKDDISLELFKRFLVAFVPLIEVPEEPSFGAEDVWFVMHMAFELKAEYRFLYRNLSDLTARIPNLDRAMRGLMSRERDSIRALLEGLGERAAFELASPQAELLVDNILMASTYWISFAELFDQDGFEEGQAAAHALARVLLMLLPYLGDHERSQFSELISTYRG